MPPGVFYFWPIFERIRAGHLLYFLRVNCLVYREFVFFYNYLLSFVKVTLELSSRAAKGPFLIAFLENKR